MMEVLDEIPVYPQERFAYYKRPLWPVLCLKRIGLSCALFLPLSLLARYKISCYQTTLLLTTSALADITLLKTTCHFLLLLTGFDTLTYRKDYDRSPILVGHQDSILAPLPGSEAPLVRKILYYVLKFIVTCRYRK